MTLEELYFVTQIGAAIAIAASLIFVGIQIRQGTRMARAQIHQNITSGWLAIVPVVTANARVFAAGLGASAEEFAKFSEEEKMVFIGTLFAFFKHYENMYFQYQCGHVEKDTWDAWSTHMFLYFRQPGVQTWWRMRDQAFAPAFRKFLESARLVEGPTPIDILSQRGA